ncbi:MAG: hypothetical protein WA885_09985 [Phormidesmis sp.]
MIRNQATGSFTDPSSGNTQNIESNIVEVTVVEVAGITVTSTGFTEAPSGVAGAGPNQDDGTINTEDVVYFTFNITNVGNDPTQFFIPGNATVTNGSISGPIQIISYDTDGSSETTLPTPIDIPGSGITTGAASALGLPNGSIAPNGTVTVRIPVKADAGLSDGDSITVVLGDTDAGNRGNQVYSDGGNNRDLYTEDNQDADTVDVAATTVTETEAAGTPTNGDATFHRQEASATQAVAVTLVTPPIGATPFICDTTLYIVIGQGGTSPFSQLNSINRTTTPFTFDPIGPQVSDYNYNALAYNPVDNFLYGIVENATASSPFPVGTVLKIGDDGVPISLGQPQGDSFGYNPNAGTFLADGTYVVGRQTNPIFTIDVTTTPPTATNRGAVSGARFEDIAVNPYDTTANRIYGIDDVSDRLVYFDLNSTGSGVTFAISGGNSTINHNHGSQFYDVFGNLLYRSGSTNALYIVEPDGSDRLLASTPTGGSHDGASCFAVGLSKEVNDSQPVPAGQNVTYTYQIANASDIAMTVTLTDDLRSVNDYPSSPDNESITPVNGIYTGAVTTPSGTVTLSDSNQTIVISDISLAPQSITPVSVVVRIPPSAVPDTYYNQATLTGLPPNFVSTVQSDYPKTELYEDPTPVAVTDPVANNPNVRLVKRIIAINRGLANEQSFEASFVDVGTPNDDDNAVNWPGPPIAATVGSGMVESYISGIANGAVSSQEVSPGDVLEYTIPFLSDGNAAARDVLVCDRIPTNTTFVADAYNSSVPAAVGDQRGILVSIGGTNTTLTNVNDGDEIPNSGGNDNGIGGYYFPAGIEPSSTFPGLNCGGSNSNGAIVVDLSDIPNATSDGIPNNSYGYIRFRAVVN